MPIELKDLMANRVRTVLVQFGEAGSIEVRYSPDAVSRDVFTAVQDAVDRNDPFGVAVAGIVPLVKGWDLEEDGKPYPITTEAVGALGLPICQAIFAAIMADFNDEGTEKKGSGSGS
jgi:hypothetical protein